MKLIELLVKREQWCEGAHQAAQDDDGYVWFYTSGEIRRGTIPWSWTIPGDSAADAIQGSKFHAELATDSKTAIVTREQYEAALAASQQPAWNGEGLPPVGTECEWQDRNTKQWKKVTVVYASEWVTVIREDKIEDPVELAIENYVDDERKNFRPIRTEAERRRDELCDRIYRAMAKAEREGNRSDMAESVYDAIAAGKIPGVKLED